MLLLPFQLGARSLEWLSTRPALCAPLCQIADETLGPLLQPEAIPPALALLRAIAMIPGGGGALLREHTPTALSRLAELVARDTSDNALRVSVMHTLADIVHGASATHDDAAAVGGMLHPHVDALIPELGRLARLPFTDVKHAAHHLLEALGARPWALPALCEAPGLLDQLLDAEAAVAEELEDRQWRYSVLRAILSCEGAEGIVGARAVSHTTAPPERRPLSTGIAVQFLVESCRICGAATGVLSCLSVSSL